MFCFEIVEIANENVLNELEMTYMSTFNAYNGWVNGGYNLTIGGDGVRVEFLTEEHKEKIRLANLNRKHTAETKQKISKSNIGKHIMSEKMKEKLLTARKGSKMSDEQKKKISEKVRRGGNPNAKKVICDSIVYDCVGDCADRYGVAHSTMKCWLNKGRFIPKEFYDIGLRYIGETRNENIKTKSKNISKIYCDYKIYETIKECAIYYGVNRETMRCWLIGKRTMPEKFKQLGLKYAEMEVCQ